MTPYSLEFCIVLFSLCHSVLPAVYEHPSHFLAKYNGNLFFFLMWWNPLGTNPKIGVFCFFPETSSPVALFLLSDCSCRWGTAYTSGKALSHPSVPAIKISAHISAKLVGLVPLSMGVLCSEWDCGSHGERENNLKKAPFMRLSGTLWWGKTPFRVVRQQERWIRMFPWLWR